MPAGNVMQLFLVDPDPAVTAALAQRFAGQDMAVVTDRLENLQEPFDCLVTAGNSFGIMDGGVDLAVRDDFPGVEAAVQDAILRHHRGELNVGDAVVVRVPPEGPLVAYAPTMRVPQDIRGTDNVYRAMRAWLVALHRGGTSVDTVVCPGLGTGYGRMSPDEAARQMWLAWRNWHTPPHRLTWQHAGERAREIQDWTAQP